MRHASLPIAMDFPSFPAWLVSLSVLGLAGCWSTPPTSDSAQSPPSPAIASPMPMPTGTASPTPAPTARDTPPTEAPTAPAAERPPTQVATLSLEGETEEISMVLYDSPAAPFTTYLPAGDFVGETASSDEGVGVRFTWTAGGTPDESVYLAFAFPAPPPNLEALRESIVGDDGLAASNGWTITETQTEALPADWAREAIAFETNAAADPAVGMILLGEHQGNPFYGILHYPVEYGEGVYPRATLILDHLEFKAN